MSNYRDSYFQYHHLTDSHHILYSEWNQDEFPPPDEQETGSHLNKGSNGGNNGNASTELNDNGKSKSYNTGSNSINVYWDYFHDEEDWDLFRNLQLESNGMATFNQPADLSSRNEGNDTRDASQSEHTMNNKLSATSITGSIFNHSVTRMAVMRNSNWNDLDIPHP